MVNAKTRKACEKRVNALNMPPIPAVGTRFARGTKIFTKKMRNNSMKLSAAMLKDVRKICGMTTKQRNIFAAKMTLSK